MIDGLDSNVQPIVVYRCCVRDKKVELAREVRHEGITLQEIVGVC